MSAHSNASFENRVILPAVLLSLCLLALVVSIFGLFRTSDISETRVNELQASWQTLIEDGVEGSEIASTNRLIEGLARPIPATHSAAAWSLGLGAMSLVFFIWLMLMMKSAQRGLISAENQEARNDLAATTKLLDEMAPLASGDLGVRASASDGVAGALAYAFNHAVSELRRLAETQLVTSRTLGESVSQSHDLATAIERHCAQQTEHVHQSSNALLGMSNSSGSLSANAAETTVATHRVMARIDDVSFVLKTSSKQIDSMRREADRSISLMQSLSQYMHPMEDSFFQLEDLARRAELLAVNTTIRNSSGRTDNASEDVERLTDEVARLGDTLARATGDARSLLTDINAESSEAISCMQRLHSGSDTQFNEMRKLGDALEEIRASTRTIHSHAELMAEQAVMHAGVVRDLSENMNLVNQITEQTGQDAQSNAALMDSLKKLANDLRQSTADFNIPDTGNPVENDSQPFKSVARRAAERAEING
ncbi:MAG: hypothetical protein AB8B97_12320 [Granulosicoccus sp.]